MSDQDQDQRPAKTEEEKKALRIAIAKDVLTSIGTTIQPTSGTYLEIPQNQYFPPEIRGQQDAQAFIPYLQKCEVCALGACLLSMVKLDNNCLLKESTDGSTFVNKLEWSIFFGFRGRLQKVFSVDQLTAIEAAFEGHGEYEDWTNSFNSSQEVMVAIMENIIENDGIFEIPDSELSCEYAEDEEDG